MDPKRLMVYRALVPLLSEYYKYDNGFLDALADQAIVTECEVEHDWLPETGIKNTLLEVQGCAGSNKANICLTHEHIGTPGKAIAIIVPLGEEDGTP